MVYLKQQNDEGDYTDESGVRYTVLSVRRLRSPDGVNQGWQEFSSLEAAISSYGLTYSPLPEEVLLEQEQELLQEQ